MNIERHFLVEWVEDDAHSIVSTKQVMHDAPMSLARGDAIDVKVKGSTYQATIVGAGKYLCFRHGFLW